MVEKLLTCRKLVPGYGARAVAGEIDIDVSEGDGLCVVGGNGTGKSTFLRTLLGLQPALSGEVSFNPSLRPGDIGYLPQQNPLQRDFPATAREVAMSGCQAMRGTRPFFRERERAIANEAMGRFGVAAFADRPYRELSGGQRQRVLLARALCAGRRLLVLDEPATGLDPGAAAELYAAMAELHRGGLATISVTHDMAGGLEGATHILDLGRAKPFFGPMAEWARSRPGNGGKGGCQ